MFLLDEMHLLEHNDSGISLESTTAALVFNNFIPTSYTEEDNYLHEHPHCFYATSAQTTSLSYNTTAPIIAFAPSHQISGANSKTTDSHTDSNHNTVTLYHDDEDDDYDDLVILSPSCNNTVVMETVTTSPSTTVCDDNILRPTTVTIDIASLAYQQHEDIISNQLVTVAPELNEDASSCDLSVVIHPNTCVTTEILEPCCRSLPPPVADRPAKTKSIVSKIFLCLCV